MLTGVDGAFQSHHHGMNVWVIQAAHHLQQYLGNRLQGSKTNAKKQQCKEVSGVDQWYLEIRLVNTCLFKV